MRRSFILCLMLISGLNPAWGRTFDLKPGQGLIGKVTTYTTRYEDTFADLAHTHDLGYNALILANPGIDPWLPGDGTVITLPGQFLLPHGPRDGILVNLSEFRLYYFPKTAPGKPARVITYPIGRGTSEFPTPEMTTRVTMRLENPTWYPPRSIRERFLRENGVPMPAAIPPGENNPLGRFALILDGGEGYMIHGTNRYVGVGMQVSHGCIRLYNEDIEKLVWDVPKGTPVHIIKQPVKVGLDGRNLWLEVHPEPDDTLTTLRQRFARRMAQLEAETGRIPEVDYAAVTRALRQPDGLPWKVGQVPEAP